MSRRVLISCDTCSRTFKGSRADAERAGWRRNRRGKDRDVCPTCRTRRTRTAKKPIAPVMPPRINGRYGSEAYVKPTEVESSQKEKARERMRAFRSKGSGAGIGEEEVLRMLAAIKTGNAVSVVLE